MTLSVDYSALEEDADFLVQLPSSVWLMDNHKWALVAWEGHRQAARASNYVLMHADYHWDAVDDFCDDEQAQTVVTEASLEELRSMTGDDKYIRYDSFIAPAIRRRLFSEVHFFCFQDDSEALEESLLEQFCVRQVIHPDAGSLAAVETAGPLIFDLCLDLFNRSDKQDDGDLWADEEVSSFLESVQHHIRAADIVTISLSFGCSGTVNDTRHLAELVVPRVLEMRR